MLLLQRRADDVSNNLLARVRLLGELHHSLPRPLSLAELELRQKQLPALARTEATIAAGLQVLLPLSR